MKIFLQNLSLRDSCYDCKFKKYNRISDITLADFWGIDNIMPEMNDNKGTSLVVINSEIIVPRTTPLIPNGTTNAKEIPIFNNTINIGRKRFL